MFELTIDDEIAVRTLHPDDTGAFFALLESNRARLRPCVHPSSLPETAQAARRYCIECYLWSLDPLTAIETPYFDEVRPYFPPFDPTLEMGIWFHSELAGHVGLMISGKREEAAEFGYWITDENVGKGIVTRCVRGLMDHAIEHLKIERFSIRCAVSNQRGRAIPERLGYRLEAILPDGEVIGEYVYDRAVYEMSAAEWHEHRQAKGQEPGTTP